MEGEKLLLSSVQDRAQTERLYLVLPKTNDEEEEEEEEE